MKTTSLITLAGGKRHGRQSALGTWLGMMGVLVVMVLLFSVLSSHFWSYTTFSTLANQIPDLMVLAVGMTFVLIIGGIDLSVGSVVALAASVVSVAILQWGWNVMPAVLLGVACAGLVGSFTGAIVAAWPISLPTRAPPTSAMPTPGSPIRSPLAFRRRSSLPCWSPC